MCAVRNTVKDRRLTPGVAGRVCGSKEGGRCCGSGASYWPAAPQLFIIVFFFKTCC